MTHDALSARLAQLAAEEQATLASNLPTPVKRAQLDDLRGEIARIIALRRKNNAQHVNHVSPAEQHDRRLS